MSRAISLPATCLTLSLAVSGCGELPEAEWAALKELRKELRSRQSDRYIAEGFVRFQREFEELRLSYRRAAAQPALLRKTGSLKEELRRQRGAAETLLTKTLRTKGALRVQQAEDLIAISRVLDSYVPTLDPALRGPLTSLQIQLAQAREFWQREEYWQVTPLLEQARVSADALAEGFEALLGRLEDPRWIRQWKKMGQETIRWSERNRKPALLIDKFGRRALLYSDGQLKRRLNVELGWNGLADKIKAGDGATPEGRYRVLEKKGFSRTRYFRALLLDYPNQADRARFREARAAGEIEQSAGIGGLIEIHGSGGRGADWTQGCVALENPAMKELFDVAYEGMPVTIVGRFEP